MGTITLKPVIYNAKTLLAKTIDYRTDFIYASHRNSHKLIFFTI